MAPLKETKVVTCFLKRRQQGHDEILLLRRSQHVGTYRGRWAGVSGYLEAPPHEQALKEIGEEAGLGLDEVTLVRKGKPLAVVDEGLGRRWLIHPYLFEVRHPEKIAIDWEHTEARWIKPEDMASYKTVPGLKEALEAVYPETV